MDNNATALAPADELMRLKMENERLKRDLVATNNLTAQNRISVPLDYENLKKENRKLAKQCKRLLKLVSYGNITTLQSLIDDYMSNSRSELKKILGEIQLTDYGIEEMDAVRKLIDHLDTVRSELSSFLMIQEEGKFIEHPLLRQCKNEIKIISWKLQHNEKLVVFENERLTEFHDFLISCLRQINMFLGDAEQGYEDTSFAL